MSGVSKRVYKRANRQASGPLLISVFLTVFDHSVMDEQTYGQTNGRMVGNIDRWTDRWTDENGRDPLIELRECI